MSQKRWNLRFTRKSKIGLVCCGLTGIVVLAGCIFLRISRPRDVEAYIGMVTECEPVWRQFAFRHFGPGDLATVFLQKNPPTHREEFGRYGIYEYYQKGSIPFSGFRVFTRDGKLLCAYAGGCTWQFTFFEREDPELDREYEAYHKAKRKKYERQRLEKLEGDLQRFYSKRGRWPTNEGEFSFFVTRRRFTTNELGIILVPRSGDNVEISLIEFPDEKRTVQKPGK